MATVIDLDDYRFVCIRDLGCTVHDTHTRSCLRANDEARADHFLGELEATLAAILPTIGPRARTLRVTLSTALGASGLVWYDRLSPRGPLTR